ncbi:MAG: hypothetical protein BGO95_03535 [Micrococcales bacterium 73-13]|nr:MAG: hypothetical protein BGO95_03535 [Micrococcales bacterium 73-13]
MSTATTAVPADTRAGGPSRILAVFRFHFVNPTIVAWMPLGITGIIFAMNWAIWFIVHTATTEGGEEMSNGTSWSGASMFIFVWLLVLAVQAMNRTFHLALGLGATRRDYYLGTVAALLVACAGWAIVFGVLGLVEDATGGWGLNGHMFASVYFGDDGPFARTWYVFLLMLFFASLGLVAGALWVRWRTWGILGFGVVLGFLLIGGLAWIALTNAWAQVGAFFAGLGFAGAYPLLLIPVVVAGLLGFLALRRATARS